MMRLLPLLGLLACHARATVPVQIEHPRDWSLPTRSTGALAGFMELYVEADTYKEWLGEGDVTGVLSLDNTAGAWADVSINGIRIGRIEPFAIAHIHEVPVGSYTVSFALPNGFVRTRTIDVEAGQAAKPDPFPRMPGQLGAE